MRWLLLMGVVACGGEDPATTTDPAPIQTSEPVFTDSWPEEWQTLETEALALVNIKRAIGGSCGELVFEPSWALEAEFHLVQAARDHSENMDRLNDFSHEAGGTSPFDRIDAAGYTGGGPQGENLGLGQTTAEEIVVGWLNSQGHCENLFDSGYQEAGIGYFQGDNGRYWTMVFGGGNG